MIFLQHPDPRIQRTLGVVIFLVAFILVMPVTGLAAGERLAITAPIANVRSGPGTDNDVLWQVERYHPIVVVEKQGNWYRFRDYEDDLGWIHSSLVADVRTVISKKRKCNVRSGPGLDNSILFTVEKGVPFKVLDIKGNWVHIEHADGDQGWIHNSLIW